MGLIQCLGLCALCVLQFGSLSHAQVSYQGRLGSHSTGLKAMSVSVYDDATNGVSLWGPASFSGVPVVDGFFNVVLPELDDSGTPLAAIGAGAAFVEVVSDGVTNSPRQQILAVPRSLDGVPAGAILPFGGQTNAVPAGWLLCDGRDVSQDRYSALFAAIGGSWGLVDTNNATFHLPDLRGQFLRGVDLDADVDPDVDARTNRVTTLVQSGVGGYQGDEVQEHNHPIYEMGGFGEGSAAVALHHMTHGAAWRTRYIKEYGGNETRPKNAAVNFIIKY